MDEVHHHKDNLTIEMLHLDNLLGEEEASEDAVHVALAVAKRVRRESNLLVRALARLRDELQT
jgi:hypothetical protein